MPQGLQVWDQAGNLVFDVTDRMTIYVGVVRVTVSSSGTGFYSYPGMTNNGTWMVYINEGYASLREIQSGGFSYWCLMSAGISNGFTAYIFRI